MPDDDRTAESWQDEAWKHRDDRMKKLVEESDIPVEVKESILRGESMLMLPSTSESDESVSAAEQTGGWCAPSHAQVFGWAHTPAMELPTIGIKRGGIRFARFPVYTTVKKMGFRTFYVQTRVHSQSNHDLIGPFKKRKQAQHAKDVVDAMNRTIDDLYWQERNSK